MYCTRELDKSRWKIFASVGITQLQQIAKQPPMKGLSVGITKLQPKYVVGAKQLPENGCYSLEVDKSQRMVELSWDKTILNGIM